MSLLRNLGKLLRGLIIGARSHDLESETAREVRDELEFHLDMRTRELVDAGLSEPAARERALEAFGSVAPVDSECRRLTFEQNRRTRRGLWLDALVRDLVAALRALRRQPLLSTAAVFILAAGFAATSVVYGIVDALLWRSLPVRDADQLVALFHYSDEAGYFSSVSYPDLVDYRAGATTLSDLVGYTDTEVTLDGDAAQPITAVAQPVTSGYFRALGIDPVIGRFFGGDAPERRGELDPVVVISHALWQQRFGGTVDAVGASVLLNGRDMFRTDSGTVRATVVGVAPSGFRGLDKESFADLWMPIGLYAELAPGFARFLYDGRGAHWLTAVGRLRDGVTVTDARAELTVLSEQQAEAYPDTNGEFRLRVFEAGNGVIWPENRGGLVTMSSTLMAGVALVLMIACANVANLLLVRASGRRTEFGVRMALGAGRGRLIRQLLTESLLLAAVSGGIGLLLATWARAALTRSFIPAGMTHLLGDGDNARIVAITLGVSLAAGIAFGLAPALRASRPDLTATLKAGGGRRGGGRASLGGALVVAQVALSLPLLVGAVLVGQSLWNQLTVDLGMSTDDLLLVEIAPGAGGYDRQRGEEIYERLLERITAMSGVVDAAYTKVAPMGRMRMATDVRIPGREAGAEAASGNVEINIVSPGYPATSGVHLSRGRDFTPDDDASRAQVVMINDAMAARYWPDGDPIGEVVEFEWFDGSWHATIIGVIADHVYGRVRGDQVQVAASGPRLYMPMAQSYQSSMTLLVRTATDAAAFALPIVESMRELSPATPDVEVVSFREHVARMLPQHRLAAGLLVIASGFGLFLAAVGIYAVMAYAVSRRAHEMGIRFALGAQRSDVMRLVMRDALRLCVAGIAIGGLTAIAASRLLRNMLYGVEATDPMSYLAVAGIVVAVAVVAAYLPARDAARSDPLPVLRR